MTNRVDRVFKINCLIIKKSVIVNMKMGLRIMIGYDLRGDSKRVKGPL